MSPGGLEPPTLLAQIPGACNSPGVDEHTPRGKTQKELKPFNVLGWVRTTDSPSTLTRIGIMWEQVTVLHEDYFPMFCTLLG
jgi:hypothetical protein